MERTMTMFQSTFTGTPAQLRDALVEEAFRRVSLLESYADQATTAKRRKDLESQASALRTYANYILGIKFDGGDNA
jgi:hypothetical protein